MVDIGIIGAMDIELEGLISMLENHHCETVSGINFHTGDLFGKKLAIAKCGIGKVFAAVCTEAMIIKYSPRLVINTGVGGGLAKGLSTGDIVVADRLVQHDMDTSAIGDELGLVSGINRVYFDTDARATGILVEKAAELGLKARLGTVATGDRFVADTGDKSRIKALFGAAACEMEGCAVAHTAFVNSVPVAVVRAISDSADEGSSMSYNEFLPMAAGNSMRLTLELIKAY